MPNALHDFSVLLQVAEELSQKVKSSKARVLDLCCGVGISTRALGDAFPDAETVIGVDTSSQMISMAQFLSFHLAFFKPLMQPLVQFFSRGTNRVACAAATTFTRGNAESTPFPCQSFDLVTIMYAFHEAPKEGRDRILREAHRLLGPGGTLAVIDICTEYEPSKPMLAGEPYGKRNKRLGK
jgi:ubiquinone/menaquinone biosynthesis C-methylase UbiE